MLFNEAVFRLIDTAKRNQIRNDSDYRENGILYCGLCHTPKEYKLTILDQEVLAPITCKCLREKREKEEAERKEAERKERIAFNRIHCFGNNKKLMAAKFDVADMTSENTDKAMAFAKNFAKFAEKGKGLLMYGKCESGKTFLACCIANDLIDRGYTVRVTNFAKIANDLLETYEKNEYIDELNSYDLLVIDDLDMERDTGFMNETVYHVIDSRYKCARPLIVTTNLTSAQLSNPDNINKQRIYSRLCEMCVPIEFKQGGKRLQIMRQDYAELKKLLGGAGE